MNEQAALNTPSPITTQRFEAKYLISGYQASAITEIIQPNVSADAHGREYLVGTTYLDSADLRLYQESVAGMKNRFKLRIRSYRNNGNGHVYLEIKRRLDQIIQKERATVRTEEADKYLLPFPLPMIDMSEIGDTTKRAFYNFNFLRESLMALPKLDITYWREAYESSFDENVRITFDRHIACCPVKKYADIFQDEEMPYIPVTTSVVVLEIKFTDACPFWVRRIIQRFNLQRQSVSKYALSVEALRKYGLPLSEPATGIYS